MPLLFYADSKFDIDIDIIDIQVRCFDISLSF